MGLVAEWAGSGGAWLGVDFGTSSTVAVVGWPDGRTRPLVFGGTPLLPSAVCAAPTGELLVGADAVNAAPAYPERFEPHPKQRIDDGALLLGDREVPVVDAMGAVLRRVVDEARRVVGGAPERVVLTHPVSWSARHRESLVSAATMAGIAGAHLVAEPVAAGHYFMAVLGRSIPVHGHLLVYDLGAGTFDVSVLRRVADGFVVLASHGLPDAGGLGIDAAVMSYLAASLGGHDPHVWERLSVPATPADRRHSRQAWEAIRAAKETLSRTGSTLVRLPVLNVDAPLGREQLDALVRPVLDRTVAAARAAVLDARVPAGGLVAILLVGGASRMPLAAAMLNQAFGMAPTVLEQPEFVVAEGSLAAARGAPAPLGRVVPAPPPVATGPITPARTAPVPQPPARSRSTAWPPRRRTWIALGTAVVLAFAAGIGLWLNGANPAAIASFRAGIGIGGNGDGDGDRDGRRGGGGTHPEARGADASGRPENSAAPPPTAGPSAASAGPSRPPAGSTGGSVPPTAGRSSNPAANPLRGPDPVARKSWLEPTYSCYEFGLRVTRTAGTSTRWPRMVASICAEEDTDNGTNVVGYGQVGCTALNHNCDDGVVLRTKFQVVLRRCGGATLETLPAGPRENATRLEKAVTKAYPPTPAVEAVLTVSQLDVQIGNNVWTTEPDSATTPCFTLGG